MPMLADISKPVPIVTEILEAYNHKNLPYYMIIPPSGKIIELDAVVLPDDLIEALSEAESRRPKSSLSSF